MTYFPDMGTRTMIDVGDHVRAVGWLSAKQPFAEGEVSGDFLARLREFADKWGASIDALGWGAYGGPHCCEFCGKFWSSGNFGVPSGELLFAAPQMVVHYVDAHRYRPPDEFIVAVLKSPMPGTHEYRAKAEPFRRLHERYVEQRRQEHLQYVGQWAFERGGTEEAVREAALRYFGDRTPEICERIRRAMPGAARVDVSEPVASSPSDGRNDHDVP